MTRALIALGLSALAAAGVMMLSTDGTYIGPDGGVIPITLPDGGAWPIAPDASALAGCNASGCSVATGTGYVEYALSADGGPSATPQPFSCGCASDAGACLWVADGGQIPSTGSYPWAAMTGPGCMRRVCNDLSGYWGTAQGCNP